MKPKLYPPLATPLAPLPNSVRTTTSSTNANMQTTGKQGQVGRRETAHETQQRPKSCRR